MEALCVCRQRPSFWGAGVGAPGVCVGGWEAVMGEHGGTEPLCSVCLHSDIASRLGWGGGGGKTGLRQL